MFQGVLNFKFPMCVTRWCERMRKIWASQLGHGLFEPHSINFYFSSGKAATVRAVAEKFLKPKEGGGGMAQIPLPYVRHWWAVREPGVGRCPLLPSPQTTQMVIHQTYHNANQHRYWVWVPLYKLRKWRLLLICCCKFLRGGL